MLRFALLCRINHGYTRMSTDEYTIERQELPEEKQHQGMESV
jgi:hypothetical protein